MKKIIILAIGCWLLAFTAPAQPQRVSLTKTADKVTVLEAKDSDRAVKIEELQTALRELSFTLDSLSASDTKLVVPTTVEEANGVLVYVLGFLQFILVGFIGDRLPKWLSPFVLSVIVGGVIAAVAYFMPGSDFTLNEAVTFFLGVSGVGNIIHQIKKPKGKAKTATP